MTKNSIKSKNKNHSRKDNSTVFKKHPSYEMRYEAGKKLRDKCARTKQTVLNLSKNRENVLSIIEKSEKGRIEELIPLRHGRMVQSPFAFYRAGALLMAKDLANTPHNGIILQACGDAHLSNFGGFATPERQIIFSINDLDETLPAPWEWDVKRLATSFVIACRHNGLSESTAKEIAQMCASSYRNYINEFSRMRQMDLWYHVLDSNTLISEIKDDVMRKRIIKRIEKARESQQTQDVFPKLVGVEGEKYFIKDQLPTIFHSFGLKPGQISDLVKNAFNAYRETIIPAYRLLLDRYQLMDFAVKVVGVGSVGTMCFVMLFISDENDALFLQVKQANESVLEPFAGKSTYENHGQRVVNGHRIMQPASDIFLGWTRGKGGRDFYFRQLRDMKIKVLVETFGKYEMMQYAGWCGRALALSHARSGDSAMLTGYMGKSDIFDDAIANFSVAYADQNEKDFEVFKKAVKSGKLKVEYEEANE